MSKTLNEDMESRRKFLKSIGGAQAVATRHGAGSRQLVHNMIRDGFYHNWKPLLIQDAEERGVEIHPELLKPRPKKIRWFSTKNGMFIYVLSQKYNDFQDMANKTGIPLSSLRFMCEASGYILYKHVPTLEEAAKEKGVPLPDWWGSIREERDIWKREGRDRKDAHLCRKKKITNTETEKECTCLENLDTL